MGRLAAALTVLSLFVVSGCAASGPTPLDAPTFVDTPAPTVPCGSATCDSDEYCIFPCSGIDAGVPLPPPQCRPLTDASCSADDPCGCFCGPTPGAPDACRIFYDPADREVRCGCA